MAIPILVRVNLPYTTGIPADVAINTFVVNDTTDGAVAPDLLAGAFADFYTADNAGAGTAIGDYMSDVFDRSLNACWVDGAAIDLATNEVTPATVFGTFTLNADPPGTPLPLEVAVCNSIVSDDSPGVPAARRRGRQFIGPLQTTTVDGTAPYPIVQSGFTNALRLASIRLHEDLDTLLTPWQIWSRAILVGPSARGGAIYGVTGGFVNNEFDTMRSRAVDATARVSWGPL